jgi:hypothetical protein
MCQVAMDHRQTATASIPAATELEPLGPAHRLFIVNRHC